MDKKLIEKMKLGNNDGLNSTLDIIKETYKNFQLVAPISPHKKRKGILDSKNMKQKINLTLLNQQIEQITILFIQKAFSVIFLDHHQRDQIEKLQENIQKRQEQEEQFRLKQEQLSQRRNSINMQKIIRPSQLMTTKVQKSIFNQNGDASPTPNSRCSSNFSQENELDLSINSDSDNENNTQQQQQIPQIQQKPSQMKRFANVVGRFIDTKRRNSWRKDLISKLGINKQVEDKFERFMSKNFTKLQRQDTVQINEKKTESNQNDNDSNDDLTPMTRSRNISLDRLVVGRQNLRNHYEEFLAKENVDISNYEDGWTKKSRNEKLFLKKSLQNLNLFQKHKDAVFKNSQTNEKLFESLNYKFYKRNEVIFHIGDDGDTYYIVLRGSVVLLLPKSNEDAELLEKEAEIRRNNKKLKRLLKNTKFFKRVFASKNLLKQKKELEKKIQVRDHIVQARESSLPLVFNLSQSSILAQGNNNQTDKEFNQEISHQQSKYSDQDTAKIGSSRKILFPQSTEDSHEEFSQLFTNSNSSSNQQRKSKIGDDKVSFFELARFLKVQESDFNYYVNKQFPLMKQIRIFGPGEAFGEIALLTKSRRTGTMVCKEDSHVMTLKKDGFDKIMGYLRQLVAN
ncbi:cyclic nucleotide-binding domain protein (macronuclear) [Tetrahymena thermophila SB210]|uniref:Cyclic nucleotide-binding domain protein n=1 Tax=Tetrahymena thermophila (strain SB210) TaxID=312017 RepID=I7MDL0_TETTS|nr:cyclic nucleotide-binding domain protein [Tetrahymena thermophila SB210]EAR89328.2 cyclic nucleotide-binding domain protein [Tetrahymena thermophila SB210]|eukprot:XP_001009573.2 cyclic nucleotide-binding domain protein [Tetrahymena thermophila SB210]